MTGGDDKELADLFAMTQTSGWAVLMQDLRALRESVNDIRSCANLEFAKGQINILDYVLSIETALRAARNAKANEAAEAESW